MASPRPTYALIKSRLENARSFCRSLITEMTIDEDYWTSSTEWWSGQLGAYISRFPDNYNLLIPGFVKWAVDTGVNQIYVGDVPVVTVTLPTPYTDQERKERLEKGLTGLLAAIQTYYGQPLRHLAQFGNALGLAGLQFPIDRGQWRDHPFKGRAKPSMTDVQKKAAMAGRNAKERAVVQRWEWARSRRLPWNVQVVHPGNLFYDMWHPIPEWYIEEKEVAYAAIQDQYPHLFPADRYYDTYGTATGTLLTYISDDWYAVYLDSQACLTSKHGADPEGVAPNRLGMGWLEVLQPGNPPDRDNDPVARIKGIIRDNRATFTKLITDFNLGEITKLQYGLPTLGFEGRGDDGDELARKALEEFELGRPWPHSDKVRQHVLDLPQIPDMIWKDNDFAKWLLEMGIGPEILWGIYRNETMGGQENRLDIANALYKNLKLELERVIVVMLTKMCWQIKHELNEDLNFWATWQGNDLAVNIHKDDIVDGMTIHVDTTPPTLRERAMKQQASAANLAVGAITLREYRADLGIYNSDEIDQQKAEDALMMHPAILDAVAGALAPLLVGSVEEQDQAGRAKAIEQGIPAASVTPPQTGAVEPQQGAAQQAPAPVSPVPAGNGAVPMLPDIARLG